jgi:hypothetical protein
MALRAKSIGGSQCSHSFTGNAARMCTVPTFPCSTLRHKEWSPLGTTHNDFRLAVDALSGGLSVNYIRGKFRNCPAWASDYAFVLTNSGILNGDAEKTGFSKVVAALGWLGQPGHRSKQRETQRAKLSRQLRLRAERAR